MKDAASICDSAFRVFDAIAKQDRMCDWIEFSIEPERDPKFLRLQLVIGTMFEQFFESGSLEPVDELRAAAGEPPQEYMHKVNKLLGMGGDPEEWTEQLRALEKKIRQRKKLLGPQREVATPSVASRRVCLP